MRNPSADDILKHLILISFAFGVGWAEYALFLRFFELLERIPSGFILVLPKLFSLLGSFLFAFLSYSSILTALSAVYRSEDVDYLLAKPMPKSVLLFYKWCDTAVRSSITVILLAIPPMISLGRIVHPPFSFYPGYLFSTLSLAAGAVSLGMLIAMGLITVFPEKRMHRSLAIIGLCLVALMITGMRFLHLETLWGEEALANPFLAYLATEEDGYLRYSPGMLFAKSVLPFVWDSGVGTLWWGGNALIGVVSILCTLYIGNKIFFKGWCKCREHSDAEIRNQGEQTYSERSFHFLPETLTTLMQKDWIVLKRDPSVWTQLFMMIPLAGIYLLNLTFLPLQIDELSRFFVVANVGLIGLIVSAVSARFLFPTASREGKSIWIPLKSPISPWRFLCQKILFSTPPILLLSLILLILSCHIMNASSALFQWSLFYGFCMSIMICVLAVSLGFCFPAFEYRHIVEVSLGKGAFLFMITALAQTGSFVYIGLRLVFTHPEGPLPFVQSWLIIWLLVWFGMTCFCAGLGTYRFGKLEV
jgi:hypothetical protein